MSRMLTVILLGIIQPGCAADEDHAVFHVQEVPLVADPVGFNHSAEPTVAAGHDLVIVASVQLGLGATSFDVPEVLQKQVAVTVSEDHGETFSPPEIVTTEDFSSDPVVRRSSDGFWLSLYAQMSNDAMELYHLESVTSGWKPITKAIPAIDKEWIAVEETTGDVFLADAGGFYRVSRAGDIVAIWNPGYRMAGGYLHEGAVRFLSIEGGSPERRVLEWSGTGEPQQADATLPNGDLGDLFAQSSASIGRYASGIEWVVHATRHGDGRAEVILRLREGGREDRTIPLSAGAVTAFMPAAVLDDEERLHAIWYESTGEIGRLVYARSLDADPTKGFTVPAVVDAAACPGDDWYPFFDTAAGGRRLREYIDIAVDGRRLHLAWTHAPEPPSRVWTAYHDF